MHLNLRNATLTQLVDELREQQERKVDLIVPARDLWSHNGSVVVRNAGEPTLTDDGVTTSNLDLVPSPVFDDGVSEKLRLPRAYLRTLRETGRTDLVDGNLNGLLHGNAGLQVPGDDRKFLLRTFKPGGNGTGYARALLSNSYKPIDNWDVLMSALSGMKAAGLDGHTVRQADLTDRKMYVRIVVPEIQTLAPGLLRNYTSPFTGERGADNPVVFAGFTLSNSETGGAAFTITPELTIEVCTNGMTITKDAVRRTHLGAKLEDEGVVQYSEATQRKNLELITSQTSDAVRTFLDVEYLRRVIERVEAASGRKVESPQEVVQAIVRRDAFSKADAEGILNHFIDGSDRTIGGMLNAITSFSQTLDDADRAYTMDADALAAVGMGNVSGLAPAGR